MQPSLTIHETSLDTYGLEEEKNHDTLRPGNLPGSPEGEKRRP